jgi:hypothetical protein
MQRDKRHLEAAAGRVSSCGLISHGPAFTQAERRIWKCQSWHVTPSRSLTTQTATNTLGNTSITRTWLSVIASPPVTTPRSHRQFGKRDSLDLHPFRPPRPRRYLRDVDRLSSLLVATSKLILLSTVTFALSSPTLFSCSIRFARSAPQPKPDLLRSLHPRGAALGAAKPSERSVIPIRDAMEESVELAHDIHSRVFRKITKAMDLRLHESVNVATCPHATFHRRREDS